ncbi:MAG: hypothetical protein ABMB14_10800 [Myxococcota bacterium]
MWALIAGPAWAQSWTVQPLYVGTDIVGATGDVAAAVALAGAPEADRLYFALVRETPNGNDRRSTLYLGILDCPGWTACPTPTTVVVGSTQDGDGPLPSIAVEEIPGAEPRIHVLHAARYPTCTPQVRRIEEHVYDPVTGLFDAWVVHEPDACADAQLSHTVIADGTVWTCWTEDPPTGGFDNQVWCGTRPLAPGPGVDPNWTTALLADGAQTQDHSWFTVADGARYAVVRDRDATPDAIDLHVDGVTGPLADGSPVQDDDFPSIARAPDGTLHAVWVEARRRISYAKCVSACDDPASWVVQPRPVRKFDTGTVDHPEIAISDTGRMFVFWSEDHDPTAADQRRIHVKDKCLSDLMFSPATEPGDVVHDLGATPIDQTMLIGRPRVWIDDVGHTLHLAWLEKDHPGANPTHGDAIWAWRAFDPCP